jgi:hypothetical protein
MSLKCVRARSPTKGAKLRLFLCLLLILPPSAWAQTTLYRAPGAAKVRYLTKLRLEKDLVDPMTAHKQMHPSPARREHLLQMLSEAQQIFLAGKDAKTAFENILSLLNSDDWKTSQREIFHYAALRLAQISTDQKIRDQWLLTALQIENEVSISAELFPPPVLARYRELKKISRKVNLAARLNGWSSFLINGVECSMKSCPDIILSNQPVRVTALSDQWVTQSLLINLNAGDSLDLPKSAWLTADCELSDAALKGQGFCEFKTDPIVQIAKLDLRPKSPLDSNPHAAQKLVAPQPPPKRMPEWIKSKWLWIGVGLVTTAAVIAANQPKQETKKEPTVSYNLSF